MPRSRTTKQSLALAHGTYRHRTHAGTDKAKVLALEEARREAAKTGRDACVWCLASVDFEAEKCPNCGRETIPF